jgi:hypothetical protein
MLSPTSHYFIPLGSKYSPQQSVLKLPSSVSFLDIYVIQNGEHFYAIPYRDVEVTEIVHAMLGVAEELCDVCA